ncbi:phosphodiesterase [Terrabacter sp. NPDC080008]|uniref:phosphodiesterase n=1 Tax=Terrabacter sp. NPDC080008 TaxID=3155176 RepID=UPI0034505C52
MSSPDRRPPATDRVPTPPSRAAGAALATGLGVVAWTTGRKPLHAVGSTWAAQLRVDSPLPGLGVPLLDQRGVHPCTVRVSRAVGTPEGWWDVGGLALRIPGAGMLGGPADLLFATTGTGRLSRYLLRPVRQAATRPLTTLLPTRAGARSVALLVRPAGDHEQPREYELAVSLDGGAWTGIGLIHLEAQQPDTRSRFDPIVEQLEGTATPPWVVALREPAYRWARRLSRRRSTETGALPAAGE